MLEFIKGKSIILRPLLESDLNESYLSWLNDPEVNSYSRRRLYPHTSEQMKQFFMDSVSEKQMVLGIILIDSRQHIGNISLAGISWIERCANVDILIGEKSVWGKGFGSEAIQLIQDHAFSMLNMHHLSAGSSNPSFIKIMQNLKWENDGIFKSYFFAV